ncbi:MAG: helix-turn-helix domain containing protein, partial [Thiopseudomonas sp.]|nr:helix-turn-helix domain containing protein [Thiopseudomonas sp.]
MSKPKHGSRFQLKAVQGFLASGLSATQYSQQNNLCRSTLCSWARRYQEHGKAAFKVKHSVATRYTK